MQYSTLFRKCKHKVRICDKLSPAALIRPQKIISLFRLFVCFRGQGSNYRRMVVDCDVNTGWWGVGGATWHCTPRRTRRDVINPRWARCGDVSADTPTSVARQTRPPLPATPAFILHRLKHAADYREDFWFEMTENLRDLRLAVSKVVEFRPDRIWFIIRPRRSAIA